LAIHPWVIEYLTSKPSRAPSSWFLNFVKKPPCLYILLQDRTP
jgi:hypothetical protein